MARTLLIALFAATAGLAACDDGGAARLEARLRAQQATTSPPQLWSAQVVGERDGGKPVLICADAAVRGGFGSVIPAVGDRHCARMGDIVSQGGVAHYQCQLDGAVYAVTSQTTGDAARDFTTGSVIHPVSGAGATYARTLPFKHEGPCPAGWNVGDTTDQQGRRVAGAVTPGA
ncbi:hypothetical protein BH09PSE2_BH09PSE2_06670 [soil metagenome]